MKKKQIGKASKLPPEQIRNLKREFSYIKVASQNLSCYSNY